MIRRLISFFQSNRRPLASEKKHVQPCSMMMLESRTMMSTVPAAPTSLKASAISSSQIQLKWSDKSNNETGFEIYAGTTKSSLTKIAAVGSNVTSYKQTPPKKNTTYYLSVRSYNSKGKSSLPTAVSAKVTGSASTGGSGGSTASGIDTVYIGPSRAIHNLDQADWPSKGDAPVRFLLDSSNSPYKVSQHFLNGNLTIESADSSDPATLDLPDVFHSSGGSSYIASNPTISVNGTLVIRNIKTVGGINTVLLGSSESANIVAQDIQMDGGALWRGNGANTAYFKDNEIKGRPRANVYSSFGGRVGTCVIDHSGTNVPVQQGGQMVGGSPIGEAAIRIMNVDDLTLKGIKTNPWFYKPGQEWKQDVQLRPSSKLIKVINCDFYQCDIGDMTWRSPAQPISRVELTDCTFDKAPNVTNGVDTIIITNCSIGGKNVSRTI